MPLASSNGAVAGWISFLAALCVVSVAAVDTNVADKAKVTDCRCWAVQGQCKDNPGFMKKQCPASCSWYSESEASGQRIVALTSQVADLEGKLARKTEECIEPEGSDPATKEQLTADLEIQRAAALAAESKNKVLEEQLAALRTQMEEKELTLKASMERPGLHFGVLDGASECLKKVESINESSSGQAQPAQLEEKLHQTAVASEMTPTFAQPRVSKRKSAVVEGPQDSEPVSDVKHVQQLLDSANAAEFAATEESHRLETRVLELESQLRKHVPTESSKEGSVDPWEQMYEVLLDLPHTTKKWVTNLPRNVIQMIGAAWNDVQKATLEALPRLRDEFLECARSMQQAGSSSLATAAQNLQGVSETGTLHISQLWIQRHELLKEVLEQIVSAEAHVKIGIFCLFHLAMISGFYLVRYLHSMRNVDGAAVVQQVNSALPVGPTCPSGLATCGEDPLIASRLRRRELQEQRTLQALKSIPGPSLGGPTNSSVVADRANECAGGELFALPLPLPLPPKPVCKVEELCQGPLPLPRQPSDGRGTPPSPPRLLSRTRKRPPPVITSLDDDGRFVPEPEEKCVSRYCGGGLLPEHSTSFAEEMAATENTFEVPLPRPVRLIMACLISFSCTAYILLTQVDWGAVLLSAEELSVRSTAAAGAFGSLCATWSTFAVEHISGMWSQVDVRSRMSADELLQAALLARIALQEQKAAVLATPHLLIATLAAFVTIAVTARYLCTRRIPSTKPTEDGAASPVKPTSELNGPTVQEALSAAEDALVHAEGHERENKSVKGRVEAIECKLQRIEEIECSSIQDAAPGAEVCPVFDMAAEDEDVEEEACEKAAEEIVVGVKEPKSLTTFFFRAACLGCLLGLCTSIYLRQSAWLEGFEWVLAQAQVVFAAVNTSQHMDSIKTTLGMLQDAAISIDPCCKNACVCFAVGAVVWACLMRVQGRGHGKHCGSDVQHDFANMVATSPVGTAVVMGLSVSQHMITAGPSQEEGHPFGADSFLI